MIIKAIDLITKSEDTKQKIALNLIKYLLIMVFSGMVYSWLFGSFELIPINDLDKILEFFFYGSFIKPLILFVIIWHFFYTIIDWLVSRYTISTANIIVQLFIRLNNQKRQNLPKAIKRVFRILKNALVQTSFLRYEKKVLITGYSFPRYKKLIKEVIEGENDIDISFLIQCFIVTVQLLFLLWILDLMNPNISFWFNLIVTIVGLLILTMFWVLISLAYVLKIYASPIYQIMLEVEEATVKFLKDLKDEKLNNTVREDGEKKELEVIK